MKSIKKKPIIITIYLILFQIICYKFSAIITTNSFLLQSSLDNKIPFIIYFIIPYITWFILLFLIPYYIYICDKKNFINYCVSFVLSIIIANIIYVIFPTTIIRPTIVGNGILESITKLVYWVDTPAKNCMPSIHCSFCLSFILFTITSKNSNKYINLFIIIISLLIMISTLLIKQHVFIDLITGCALSLIVYIISIKNKYLHNKFKKIFKM